MKLHHLQALMKEFLSFKPDGVIVQEASSYFPSKIKEREPGMMNLQEFKSTVSKVLKTNEYDEYLEKLFLKVLNRLTTSYTTLNGSILFKTNHINVEYKTLAILVYN